MHAGASPTWVPDAALSTQKRGVPIDAYNRCDHLCIILMKEEIQKQIIVGAVDGGDNCRDSAAGACDGGSRTGKAV